MKTRRTFWATLSIGLAALFFWRKTPKPMQFYSTFTTGDMPEGKVVPIMRLNPENPDLAEMKHLMERLKQLMPYEPQQINIFYKSPVGSEKAILVYSDGGRHASQLDFDGKQEKWFHFS